MANTEARTEFVSMVAEELIFGIDRAVGYWLARIEQELANASRSSLEQLRAIQRVVQEYKEATGKTQLACASAGS